MKLLSLFKVIMSYVLPDSAKKMLAPVRLHLRLYKSFYKDLCRYYRYSGFRSKFRKKKNIRSMIAINYHRVEKGLSLKNCRKGFGLWYLSDLQNDLINYAESYGIDDVWCAAYGALSAYYRHSEGFEFDSALCADFTDIENKYDAIINKKSDRGGVKQISAEQLEVGRTGGYAEFVKTRHSIRQFTDVPVERELILQALEHARYAPSACNRQPSRVYSLLNRKLIGEILSIQGGAKGFDDQVNKLMVLTVDLHEYHTLGERNEAWVDGGIYLGHLLQSIHAVGLGSCCLNWCVDLGCDQILRKRVGVPDSEVIIALIAVGHIPSEITVALSPRLQVSTVFKEVE